MTIIIVVAAVIQFTYTTVFKFCSNKQRSSLLRWWKSVMIHHYISISDKGRARFNAELLPS